MKLKVKLGAIKTSFTHPVNMAPKDSKVISNPKAIRQSISPILSTDLNHTCIEFCNKLLGLLNIGSNRIF